MTRSVRRVLVVHHTSFQTRGGAEKVLERLVTTLSGRGVEVTTWTFDDLPSRIPLRFRRLALPYLVAWRLIARRAAGRFDVIDSATGDCWLYLILSRRRTPVIVRSHGLEPLGERAIRRHADLSGRRLGFFRDLYYRWWMPWEVRTSLQRADLVRVLNRAELDYCVKDLEIPANRVVLAGNGFDPALFPMPQLDRRPRRVVAIGRWEPMKGSADLAGGLSRIMAAHQDVTLTLLGTGLAPERVLANFPALLQARIRVVAEFDPDDASSYLAGHHLYVSASHSEGFSLALVEAMALGVVPVASRVGAAPDLIEGFDCGMTYPAGDVDALVAALNDLLQSADLERLAVNARQRVAEMTWPDIVSGDLDHYEAIVSRAARRRSGTDL